ncbi:MAG: ROK family protein [Candidatus Acidiferrales bacterium]
MSNNRRSSKNLVLGVDIGGTKVAVGLVNSHGQVVYSNRAPMLARESADQGFRAVRDAIDKVALDPRAKNIEKIGVCVPGWVDAERGVVLSAANLPCWRNYPLARKIKNQYSLPTRLANDANAAALAEARWGAARGYESSFYVTLGTGIGTAFILRGEIYDGRSGAAGEGGHMTINFRGPLCGCGKRGCIEMYASGTAIAKRARNLLRQGTAKRSLILKMAESKISGITGEAVSKAAQKGDRLAKKILEEAADYLGTWLTNIVDLLEPEAIIFGGGMGRVMMSLCSRVQKNLVPPSIQVKRRGVPIINAHYGSESALVGAAAQWFPPSKPIAVRPPRLSGS